MGGTSVASAAVVSAAAGRRPEAAEEEGCVDCMHEADVESDEQDVAGWLKVSPPVSERWCKKFGGQTGLTSKGCGEKACLGCGMAECDSSLVYSTDSTSLCSTGG